MAIVVALARMDGDIDDEAASVKALKAPAARDMSRAERRRRGAPVQIESPSQPERRWLPATVLALTGFASLMFEITWTRVLSLTRNRSDNAFAATLAVLIGGMASAPQSGHGWPAALVVPPCGSRWSWRRPPPRRVGPVRLPGAKCRFASPKKSPARPRRSTCCSAEARCSWRR